MKKQNVQNSSFRQIYTTILVFVLALVAIASVTAAWFSIANRTRVHSMSLDVTAGPALRFDLDEHDAFEDYLKTLSFDQIAERVQRELGYDMHTAEMKPVTTEDGAVFTLRNGTVEPNTSGAYWEYTLHFMGSRDMTVHLTSADSGSDVRDGTRITSDNAKLPPSMRISFTADGQTVVFDPGMGDFSVISGKVRNFGLPSAGNMVYNNNSILFNLSQYVDKTVVVRIWLEGTDEDCTDDIKQADFAIRLRFAGTDADGNSLEE